MRSVIQDLRYGWRLLMKSRGFAAVAIVTVGLGIGANVAVFSVVDATLLRPLPYKDPQRLVDVLDRAQQEPGRSKLFASYADFRQYRQHARSFEDVAAATWAVRGSTLTGRGPARSLLAIPVTESFFRMLGVAPEFGRTFAPGDVDRGCSVVLSRRFWTNVLGGDRKIVGQTLTLNDRPCSVLGVMPSGFAFYPDATQLWTLLTPAFRPAPDGIPMITFGRLKPGVTAAQAETELSALHASLHQADGKERGFVPEVAEVQEQFTWLAGRNLRSTLWILFGAVGLVMLVACWNVAGLLLGRGAMRRRELAVRAALGGGRGRLFRQLLAEGLLLSGLGGGLGLAVAFGLVEWFRSVNPVELPPGVDVRVSLPVLFFAMATAILATVVFGFAPAWKTSRVDLIESLKSGGRGMTQSRQRLARVLVASEMAGSVLLLSGAGLLMESVLRMGSAPLGLDPDHVYRARIALPAASYSDASKRVRFAEALLTKLATSPGMRHSALASMLPPATGGTTAIQIQGRPPVAPEREIHDVAQQSITPGYLATLGVPLFSGRDFDRRDGPESLPVAIVNEALVHEYFHGEDPLGRQIRLGEKAPWTTIVGIIGTEKRSTVYQEMAWVDVPMAYRPVAQTAPEAFIAAVRVENDSAPVEADIRRAVAAVDTQVAIEQVEPLREDFARLLAFPKFRAAVLAGFAAFALLLAAIGLEGVLAQMVAQRKQEVGIRMALGARPASIVRLIAVQGGAAVVVGLTAGLFAAMFLGRVLRGLLYEARPADPILLGAIAVLLLAVAALAIIVPARTVASTDPMTALRTE